MTFALLGHSPAFGMDEMDVCSNVLWIAATLQIQWAPEKPEGVAFASSMVGDHDHPGDASNSSVCSGKLRNSQCDAKGSCTDLKIHLYQLSASISRGSMEDHQNARIQMVDHVFKQRDFGPRMVPCRVSDPW